MTHKSDTTMPLINTLIDTVLELQKQGTGVALLQRDDGKFAAIISEDKDNQGVLIEANMAKGMPSFEEQFEDWKLEENQ